MIRGPLSLPCLLELPRVVEQTLSANVGPFPVPLAAKVIRREPDQSEGLPEVRYRVPEEYRALYGL